MLKTDQPSWNATISHALDEEPIRRAEKQAIAFLENIEEALKVFSEGSVWIFGDDVGPTALDAHTVPFVARMIDAKRSNMVPATVLKYALRAMEGDAWQSVTLGRPTTPGKWMRMVRPPRRL